MPLRSSRRPRHSRAGAGWFRTGYAGIIGFFALEITTREPGAASNLQASGGDRGTTSKIGIAYAVASELPLVLRRLPTPQLPRQAGPVGLIVQASGLALRAWSMRTLGSSYSRTLRTDEAQYLVMTGPYHWVRHPGYTGSLLVWLGYALTSRNLPALLMITALLGRVYYQRINAEEALLERDLPGYEAYSQHTHKLIPFVW